MWGKTAELLPLLLHIPHSVETFLMAALWIFRVFCYLKECFIHFSGKKCNYSGAIVLKIPPHIFYNSSSNSWLKLEVRSKFHMQIADKPARPDWCLLPTDFAATKRISRLLQRMLWVPKDGENGWEWEVITSATNVSVKRWKMMVCYRQPTAKLRQKIASRDNVAAQKITNNA